MSDQYCEMQLRRVSDDKDWKGSIALAATKISLVAIAKVKVLFNHLCLPVLERKLEHKKINLRLGSLQM